LQSLRTPNLRLYVRVNTIKITSEKLAERLNYFRMDEDLPEALYVEVKGPHKVDIKDTIVIVDKRAAESAMLGAYVYKPGIKKVIGKKNEVTVVAEDGTAVAEGILRNDKIIITRSLYYTPPLAETEEFKEGLFYIQEKPSMYVARLVDPKPNEIIVDMNCAPGGKLTHLYQLEPRARIIGVDRTKNKISKTKELLNRLDIKSDNIKIIQGDSRYLYEDYGIRNVDKVIIDPPCSALGIRPKIFDKKSKDDLLKLSLYQKQFINAAYKILKPNGILVYSTCTVTFLENEEIINDPRFEIEEIIRFHTFVHNTPGYFIAKLRKRH
ncbi:MAG: RsmB/NOP family class I SAM-dependent RNA methyltransferase, partial [Sulfolobaceae archaeon]